MNISGKSQTIANEMKIYGKDILGISEVRWRRAGQIHLTTGELILYSGHMDDKAIHSEVVAIMISKEAQRTLIGWETIRKCNKKDITMVMGDMNAKVGNDKTGFEEIMGKKEWAK